MDLLCKYNRILTQFSLHVDDISSHDRYRRLEESCIHNLRKVHRVMKTFSLKSDSAERDRLLEIIRGNIKMLTQSLDRKSRAIHDDIRSLNSKNSRLGLSYNRYYQRTAEPGMIDIRT